MTRAFALLPVFIPGIQEITVVNAWGPAEEPLQTLPFPVKLSILSTVSNVRLLSTVVYVAVRAEWIFGEATAIILGDTDRCFLRLADVQTS